MERSLKRVAIENRIKRRRAIIRTVCSFCVVVVALLALKIPAVTLGKDLPTPDSGKGHFQVRMPENLPEGEKVDISIGLYKKSGSYKEGWSTDWCYKQVDFKGGNTEKVLVNGLTYTEDPKAGNFVFTGLSSGDVVTIVNYSNAYTDFLDCYGEVTITSSNAGKLTMEPGSETELIKNNIASIQISYDDSSAGGGTGGDEDFTSLTTYKDLYGEYSIQKLLSYYNAFSFKDIEGKHIFGSVASNNEVYKFRDYSTLAPNSEKLFVSEYPKGISSFVRNIYKHHSIDGATFELGYGYDQKCNLDFYTGNNLSIKSEFEGVSNKLKYYIYSKNERFKSPNNLGDWKIYKNSDFIDFNEVKQVVNQESTTLLNHKGNIVLSPDEKGYLKIPELGKNYLITNSERLRIVDFTYPSGYHPTDKPYPYPTVINIQGSLPISGEYFPSMDGTGNHSGVDWTGKVTLPNLEVDGKSEQFQFFPLTYVDGKAFYSSKAGYQGEYGDYNGIVFNIPNATNATGRLTFQRRGDTLGHIVCPNVTLWNAVYEDNKSKWGGGNINGSIIAESVHVGELELHSWPIDGLDIIPKNVVELSLSGKKNYIDNTLYEGQFTFILELFNKNNGVPDGLEDKNLNQSIKVDKDGNIKFLPVTFTKAGKYEFRIKEDTTNIQENVTYDRSEYRVVVTVVESSTGELTTDYKVLKTKDLKGSALNPEKELGEVIFTNYYGNPKFASFAFTKVDSADRNKPLKGAVFELIEIVSKEDHTEKGTIKIIEVSDESGRISFKDIPSDKVYKLVETVAPKGYRLPRGYWILDVVGTGDNQHVNITNSSEMVPYIGDDWIIPNKFEDYLLPETGGSGIVEYTLLGCLLILISTLFWKYKFKKKYGGV